MKIRAILETETLDGLPQEQRAELLNEVLNETLIEGSLNDD